MASIQQHQQHQQQQQQQQPQSSNDEWKDLKTMLQEIETIFTNNTDLQDVIEINQYEQRYQQLTTNRMKDAKEILKEMAGTIARKESEILAPTNAQHIAQLKQLTEKENHSQQIQELTQFIDFKKEEIQRIQAMNLILQERSQEYSLGNNLVDSRTAYALSLYGKISNISFDYQESDLSKGKLVGYAGNEKKKELSKFEYNLNEMSEYSLANKLWAIIEENC